MKELLEMLEKGNAHSVDELAAMLQRPKAEVAAQQKELEEQKIIVKYQTIINWDKAGVEVTAFIGVRTTPQREVGFDAIAERIYRFPEVRDLYLMSGNYDLIVLVEGDSLKDIARFVYDKLATIDGVISTSSHFVLKKYKQSGVVLDGKEVDCRLVISP